jgi:hypothetical protein
MNTHSAEQHWFVSLNGKRHGPYTFAALTEAAAKGVIAAETKVWRLGWQRWHPARTVPGLLNKTPHGPESAEDNPRRTDKQRPEKESVRLPSTDNRPLADDRIESPSMRDLAFAYAETAARPKVRRTSWDEGPERSVPRYKPPARDEDALLDAPHLRRSRSSFDHSMRGDQPRQRDRQLPEDGEDVADEWGMLEVRQGNHSLSGSSRFEREKTPKATNLDDVAKDRPAVGEKMADKKPAGGRVWRFCKRAAVGLFALLLLAGAGWGLFVSGLIVFVEPRTSSRATALESLTSAPAGPRLAAVSVRASADGLPASVASLPAVLALQRNDPASFERFKKRYLDSAADAKEDELLSIARAALRKSVKRLLAISTGDTLLEITEAYLAYMQGLRSSSPESCVALSDESKGARLTSNLAKYYPNEFIRDMSVLERVANANPNATVAPLTADQARPYLDTVFKNLRQQPVKSELLGRGKLDPSEFQPYCALVIAFYQTVLEQPRDDKINLLRYLYASAAITADNDLAR